MMKVVVEPSEDAKVSNRTAKYYLSYWDDAVLLDEDHIWAYSDAEAREIADIRLRAKVDARDKEVVRKARIFEITEEEL